MQVISFNESLPSNIPVDCILVISDRISCSFEIKHLLSLHHQGASYKCNDLFISGATVTRVGLGEVAGHGASLGEGGAGVTVALVTEFQTELRSIFVGNTHYKTVMIGIRVFAVRRKTRTLIPAANRPQQQLSRRRVLI